MGIRELELKKRYSLSSQFASLLGTYPTNMHHNRLISFLLGASVNYHEERLHTSEFHTSAPIDFQLHEEFLGVIVGIVVASWHRCAPSVPQVSPGVAWCHWWHPQVAVFLPEATRYTLDLPRLHRIHSMFSLD